MVVITEDIQTFCNMNLADTVFEIHPIIRFVADDYNPWHLSVQKPPVKADVPIMLDKKDYTLLSHLCKNPLDSILEISETTGLDRKTIKQRIDVLLQKNVIEKFRYGINIYKIGFIVYLLKIDLSPRAKQKVFHKLRSDDYAGFIFELLNGYVMYYMPPSHNDLFNFTDIIRALDGSIKIDVIQTTEVFQINLAPDSVMQFLKKKT